MVRTDPMLAPGRTQSVPASGAMRRPAPRRRGSGPAPILVLALFALGPAIALFAVFTWADGSYVANESAPPPPTTVVAPPPFADPLLTPVYSLRRFPSTLSRRLNFADFQRSIVPFLGAVNDRSCTAISVNGAGVGVQNPDLPVIPASNEKLIVAAVALDVIGTSTTFTTRVVTAGPTSNGSVDGDLFLVGGGDPLLSSDWYPTSNLERFAVTSPTSLDSLADAVAAAGITNVTGAVVGDGTRYDDEFFAPGWGNGVAGLEAGPYDALMANDARVLNDPLRASDPNEGAAREFARMLRDRGVVVGGAARSGAAPTDGTEVAAIESAPLTDIVAEMLGNSDNNTAELLVKEIGLVGAQAGTREAGAAVMMDTLAKWGIDTTGLVLSDGSGLSLQNRLTCGSLLAVLQRYRADGPLGSGLPVAGQTGTLQNIFTDHPISGRLLGKTGTLNNPPFNADPPAVKALAGYVTVEGSEQIEYVLILNGPTISDQSEYRPVWNAMVDVLAPYPSNATAADLGPRTP